ncbi:MAG: aminodeoxychorismate/anthranilate synthase component II [Bacteroidetes bacterium]|nr:aminodeoxychorismate/anthranilate synthase component II [Bacteroidota bacterium]
MRIALIDCQDSFVFNLAQILKSLPVGSLDILPAKEVSLEKLKMADKIMLSPGPGLPDDFPVLHEVISTYSTRKSILGICLGLQAITTCFGGKLVNLDQVFHGLRALIHPTEVYEPLFDGIVSPFQAGLYHSWAADEKDFPGSLSVTSRSENGIIMSVAHQHLDVKGLQFHPESILTPEGSRILRNWVVG